MLSASTKSSSGKDTCSEWSQLRYTWIKEKISAIKTKIQSFREINSFGWVMQASCFEDHRDDSLLHNAAGRAGWKEWAQRMTWHDDMQRLTLSPFFHRLKVDSKEINDQTRTAQTETEENLIGNNLHGRGIYAQCYIIPISPWLMGLIRWAYLRRTNQAGLINQRA